MPNDQGEDNTVVTTVGFTPSPWVWHTSCSWKRLMRDFRGKSTPVLMPYVAPSDNHPDIDVSPADMALIAASPDLYEALKSWLAWHDDYAFPTGTPTQIINKARAALRKAKAGGGDE